MNRRSDMKQIGLMLLLLMALNSTLIYAESHQLKISKLKENIVTSSFSEDHAPARKGPLLSWRSGIGTWRVENKRLIGDELEEDHHASSLTHEIDAGSIVIKAQIRLNTASKIAFACRDTVPPKNHVGRLFIMKDKLWIQRMSGIGKTTKSQKLVTKKVDLDPQKWYDVTIEIIGDHYHAKVGEVELEAKHARFSDQKGIIALVNQGQGAEFRNVSIWHAEAK